MAVHQRLLGVVLCGGRSSRMGRDKAQLRHASGGTFLEHAVGRLESICDAVIISGKSDTDGTNLLVVKDPIAHQGPATGIAAALRYAQQEHFTACLITPVDTPFLSKADLRRLQATWHTAGQLTIALSDHIEPLIGIYPTNLADEVRSLANSEDRSLLRWIERQDYAAVTLPASSCRNINSPEDYGSDR